MIFADDEKTVQTKITIIDKEISIVKIEGFPLLVMEADGCQRQINRYESQWKQLADFAYFLKGCR